MGATEFGPRGYQVATIIECAATDLVCRLLSEIVAFLAEKDTAPGIQHVAFERRVRRGVVVAEEEVATAVEVVTAGP